MALFFGDISAFTFWRMQRLPRSSYGRCRSAKLECSRGDHDALASALHDYPLAFRGCFHLCVSDRSMRKDREHISYSVISPPVPQGSFVKVDETVYVASPELCYAQMASWLTPCQLMRWGMELCGTYSIDLSTGQLAQRGFSLTNAHRINVFLDGYSGRRGARRAKESARWLMDGSASPPESQLALVFRIPRQASGCGLGIPDLNRKVPLSPEMQKIAGKPYYIVDQYWPRGKVAVEYESNAIHSNEYQIVRDRKRQNILQRMGIRVITVSTAQLRSSIEIDDIADQIAEACGRRRGHVASDYPERHASFHRELMHIDKELYL